MSRYNHALHLLPSVVALKPETFQAANSHPFDIHAKIFDEKKSANFVCMPRVVIATMKAY